MAKRRNVIIGMGTLAFGSGTVIGAGAAFSGDTTTPSANFQILADALTVRRRSDSDSNVEFVSASGDLTTFADYSRSDLPKMELIDAENGSLEMQIAAETGTSYTFTEPLEIANDTADTYDLAFHYAESGNIDSTHTNWGYGSDVNDADEASTTESSDGVSYETVNGIFVFDDNSAGDTSGGTQISPSGTNVESSNTISLSPGQVAAIDVTVDTTNDTGKINSAATGQSDPDPWEGAATYVDLMNEVHVDAATSG